MTARQIYDKARRDISEPLTEKQVENACRWLEETRRSMTEVKVVSIPPILEQRLVEDVIARLSKIVGK